MHGYTDITAYDPCPCGSGKKYKFCCFKKDREVKREKKKQSYSFVEDKFDVPREDLPKNDLERALDLNRTNEELLAKGKINEALIVLEKAKRILPNLTTTHNNIANCKYFLGNLKEAISIEKNVIRNINPDNVYALGNLVHFYLITGKESLANSYADQLFSLKLVDITWLYKKCEAFARLKRHEDVISSIEGYSEPIDYLYCHFFAGIAYANVNEFGKAISHLQKIKSHHHKYSQAQKYIEKIQNETGPDTLYGDWQYFEIPELISQQLLGKIIESLKIRNETLTSDNDFAKKYPILSEVGLLLFNNSEGSDTQAIDMLGKMNIPKSNNILIKIAEGTFGSDECRFFCVRSSSSKWSLEGGDCKENVGKRKMA